jgi:hypothetical protein
MRVCLFSISILIGVVQPVSAQDNAKLIGSWKLVSWTFQDVETRVQHQFYGTHPKGYITFTPEGRFFAVLTSGPRTAPQSEEDRATAFRRMVAYTGKYRLERDKFITNVDVAWTEAWVGRDQVRFFRFDGDKLQVESAPSPSPNFGGKLMRGILTWEKENK